MKKLSFEELSPYEIYPSQITSKILVPREKEFIEDKLYHITQAESFFILPLVGNAEMKTDDVTFPLVPGSLTYVPPYQCVTYSESGDFEYLRVQFILNDIATNEPIIFNTKPILLLEKITEELKGIMYEIYSYCPADTVIQQFYVASAFYKMLAVIATHISSTPRIYEVNPKIYTVIKYLNNNFMRNDTTKFLADMANLSEPYFRKCFKQITSMTPIEYRNYLRIEAAKHSITCSSKYNTSRFIAQNSGFDDIHYFQKLFKKYTGVTPLQYYKMHFPNEPAKKINKYD